MGARNKTRKNAGVDAAQSALMGRGYAVSIIEVTPMWPRDIDLENTKLRRRKACERKFYAQRMDGGDKEEEI